MRQLTPAAAAQALLLGFFAAALALTIGALLP